MSDPIQLRAAETEAVPDVIESLEGLLERARAGELRGFIFVGCLTGDESVVLSVGELDCPRVIVNAEAVKHRAMREWLGP